MRGDIMEKTSKTRTKIVAAFWHLYKSNGLNGISVKDITDKASLNRSTFYEYFKDINDVLNYLERNLIKYINKHVVNNTMYTKRIDLTDLIVNLYIKKGDYLSILLGSNGDPNFSVMVKNELKPFFYERFNIQEETIKADIAFEFIIVSLLNICSYWYINRKKLSEEEFKKEVNLLLSGSIFSIEKLKNKKN